MLTPRDADRDHVALVCDWRGRGTGVTTILCPPLAALDDFERLVARDAPWPHAAPVAQEAPVALQDAFERQFIQLLNPVNQHEWVVPVVAVADSESTTTTVTARLPLEEHPMPQEERPALPPWAAEETQIDVDMEPPVDVELPAGICRPADLCHDNCAHHPLADFCLFPSLGAPFSAGRPEHPHTFTVLAAGRPVTTLPANTAWSAAQFFHAAFAWLGHTPRQAQMLTPSLPGLPEPQIVLTTHDAPSSALVVPVDFRGVGGGVVPTIAVPGQPAQELVHDVQILDTVHPFLPLFHDLFLQDTRGGVHDQVPALLDDVQWLRVCSLACSAGSPCGPLTSTTTTSTGMQTSETRVRFVLTGGDITVQLPPVPVTAADPVEAVAELLFSMASAGRLQERAVVTLGAAWPSSTRGERIVPFVVSAAGEHVRQMVLFDPSYDGSQLYAMGVQPGLFAEDLMSNNYRQCGLTMWVNGVHMSAMQRPLRTGDYVQLLPDRVIQAPTAIHPEDLLDSINRLRAFSAPLPVPPFSMSTARAPQEDVRRRSRAALIQAMDIATRTRVEMMGLPARVSQAVTLIEPGRAPHRLHLPLRLTPTLAEAEELVRDTGLVPNNYRLIDTLLDSIASSVFISLPPGMPGLVYTICDPSRFGAFILLHLPRGVRPPTHRLPVRQGFVLALPAHITDGAHIATARPIVYAPANRRPAHTRPAPDQTVSTATSMDTASGRTISGMSDVAAAPETTLERPAHRPSPTAATAAASSSGPPAHETLSEGTSLVQLTVPIHRRQQLIFDDSPESARASAIAAASLIQPPLPDALPSDIEPMTEEDNPAQSLAHSANQQPETPRPLTVPTPLGRRVLRANPCDELGCNSLVQGPRAQSKLPEGLSPMPPSTGPPCSTQIHLAEAVPAPTIGAAWGVNQDIAEHALSAHRLPIPDLVSVAKSVPPIASHTWRLLDEAPTRPYTEAVLLYTDGSFAPRLSQASWAFVAVGKQGDRLHRLGSLAGRIPETETPSAYRGELWALTHALAFTAANQIPQAVLASDCQAALDVAFGQAQAAEDDPVGLAAQSLLFLCRTCGLNVRPIKVEAHSGIPMNEAADAVAKTANLEKTDRLFAFDAEILCSCIAEGTVHRLWLAYSGRSQAAQLPPLDAQGCWSSPACGFPPGTQAGCSSVSTAQSDPLVWRLTLGIITYNCLSARSQPARELLDSGLHSRQCALAGFQEARCCDSGITHTAHYWVASSGCDEHGGGGCQVWISKTLAWGHSRFAELRPQRDSFSMLVAEPRLLIVLLRVGQLKFACVAAHAPTTTSGPRACKQWWKHLQIQCKKVPPGHVLLLMVDANAPFTQAEHSGDTMTAVPSSENSKQLQKFCAHTGLQPTAQCDRNGAPLYSWTSPDGDTHRLIDYVCVPTEWRQGLQTEPQFSLNDLRAGYDHEPIQGTVRARLSAPQSPARRTVPVTALRTEEGRRIAAVALASVPTIPWEVDATTHMDLIFEHVYSFLQQHLPAAPPRPRNPILSELSLRLVLARREVRTVKRRLDKTYRQGLLFQCFAAWGGRTDAAQTQARRLDSLSQRVSRAGFSLSTLHKAIGESFSVDQANFARQAIENSRAGGASDFAHSIRALLRSGRRFRAPQLLHSISDGKNVAACDTDILDMLGRHFAGPERAHQSSSNELLECFDQTKPLSPGLDMTTLPHVADIISSTMAQKSGKAAGISGIPAELYKTDAVATAQLLFPVLVKSVVRGCGPMQHNGGLARAIPKGKLQAGTPAGWRSILLLEPSGKILQKAYRKQLIVALDQYKSRNQFGGLPKRRLEEPSVIVRAHFSRLRARQQTGGALFIDSRAAYYSLVRDALVESCTRQDEHSLWRRAKQLFPFPDDQHNYVRHMQAGGLVKALQLPAPLVRYLESQLGTTWFSMSAPITTAYISGSGTAPGSPIADLLFSFVYARFLNHAEELLLSEGHFVALCPDSAPAVMPTWADDTAVLIGPLPPKALAPTLQRVTELVSAGLSSHGLDPNFGPGKTEAVVHFGGSGSQAARRALLCIEDPGVQFQKRAEGPCKLRLVPTYVHLGTVVSHNALETPNLHYRAMLLRQLFVPLRKRLLFNRNLTRAEKVRILEERALPKFLFGAGLWTLRTVQEQALAVEPIQKALRQAFRPILGVSSEGFTNDEIAAALGLPTAAQFLEQAQAAALLHLAHTASEEVCAGLSLDGTWYGQAWNALRRVMGEHCPVALCFSQPPGLGDLLTLLPANCGRLCRNYLRVCKQGRPPVDLRPRSAAAAEAPIVQATAHPALTHVCNTCGVAFLNARRLAVHRARKHGELSLGTAIAWGTRCEKCGVEFWHPCRLAQHLNRSLPCRQVYAHSDLQPSSHRRSERPHLPGNLQRRLQDRALFGQT